MDDGRKLAYELGFQRCKQIILTLVFDAPLLTVEQNMAALKQINELQPHAYVEFSLDGPREHLDG